MQDKFSNIFIFIWCNFHSFSSCDRLVQFAERKVHVFQVKDALQHAIVHHMFVINAMKVVKD